MAIQLETLEQVIEFVAKMKPETAAQIVDQFGQTFKKVEAEAEKSQDKLAQSFSRYLQKRSQLQEGDLKAVAQLSRRQLDIEKDMLSQKQKALEKQYAVELEMARKNRAAGLEITNQMKKDKIDNLQTFLKESEALEAKRRALGGRGGKPPGGFGGMAMSAAGGAGQLAQQAGITGGVNVTGGGNPWMAVAQVLLQAVQGIHEFTRQFNITSNKLATLTTGGLVGAGQEGMMGASQREALGRTFAEEMVSLPKEMRAEMGGSVMEMARNLKTVTDDASGLSMSFVALETIVMNTGLTQQQSTEALIELQGKFGMTLPQATVSILQLSAESKKAAEEIYLKTGRQVAASDIVKNMMKLAETMLPLGGGFDEATARAKQFALELSKGVLTLQDLQALQSGAKDQGTLAYIATTIQESLSKEFPELGKILEGLSPAAAGEVYKRAREDSEALGKETGLDPKKLRDQSMEAMRRITDMKIEETLPTDADPRERVAMQRLLFRQFTTLLEGLPSQMTGQQQTAYMTKREQPLEFSVLDRARAVSGAAKLEGKEDPFLLQIKAGQEAINNSRSLFQFLEIGFTKLFGELRGSWVTGGTGSTTLGTGAAGAKPSGETGLRPPTVGVSAGIIQNADGSTVTFKIGPATHP